MRSCTEENHTWEVPWDDLTDNAEGFADGVGNLVLGGLDGLTVDLVCESCVVAQYGDGTGDISVLGPAERFTNVESLESCDLVLALLNQLCELVQEPAALVSGGVQTPSSLECLLGSLNSEIDIFGSALSDLGKEFACRRIDNPEYNVSKCSSDTTL